MNHLQGRYLWVEDQGERKLLRVQRGEQADIKSSVVRRGRKNSDSEWISLTKAEGYEHDLRMWGCRLPPSEVADALQSLKIPYECDSEEGALLLRPNDFLRFLSHVSLNENPKNQ
jgi:hypothetical protein